MAETPEPSATGEARGAVEVAPQPARRRRVLTAAVVGGVLGAAIVAALNWAWLRPELDRSGELRRLAALEQEVARLAEGLPGDVPVVPVPVSALHGRRAGDLLDDPPPGCVAHAASGRRNARVIGGRLPIDLADGAARQNVVELEQEQVFPGCIQRREVHRDAGGRGQVAGDLGFAQGQLALAIGTFDFAVRGVGAAMCLQIQFAHPNRQI